MTVERVALVQFDPTLGPADDGTLERLCDRVRSVGGTADLIVFPELATTGYSIFDQIEACAESIPGPTTRAIGAAAAEAEVHVLVGMAVRADDSGDDVTNSAVWIDRTGTVRARYDKYQPWGDERSAFGSGDRPLVVSCEGWTFGLQICYDLNFPEVSAAFARAGVDAVVNVSAWSAPMAGDWDRLLPARAIENGAYVLGCNRAGTEGDLEFYGRSTAYDPDGSVLDRLGADEDVLSAHLSKAALSRERERNPMRRDRRPESPSARRVAITPDDSTPPPGNRR
ncbi:carbon-nitrogen hydrolase family protein [Halovivax sp.]|uniref:carbon-nitrogen hydrolase family protein n=1 Tax=Halovivax sp. TaxID=1935978 RepID=UPI0025BE0C0F|nr:carbon-nitrogen hydrolase family protein [Halovivax sp.]